MLFQKNVVIKYLALLPGASPEGVGAIQDEWEPYFKQYAEACQAVSLQISETDGEIDTRVFDLITPEEHKVGIKTDTIIIRYDSLWNMMN